MALAESNRVKIRYLIESVWGETPTPQTMTELLVSSESLAANKETVISQTIRSDRQRPGLLEVGQNASGDLGFELAYGDYEPLMANAMRNAIASANVSHAAMTVAASSLTNGAFLAAGYTVGQWLRFKSTGHSNSGALIQLETVGASTVTFTGTTLAASTVSAVVTGRTLTNGITKNSFLLEADFSDIAAVKYQTGVRMDTMAFNIAAQQIVTGTFGVMGKGGFNASATVASATTSAAQQTAMTAAANVSDIRENGVLLANTVQAMTVNLSNNMRSRPHIGSKYSAEHGDGGVDVSGTANIYFEDKSLYDKMLNHSATSLGLRMTDVDGNAIVLSLPNVYFASGDPAAPGQDQDVFLSLNWTAILDATEGITMRIDMLPA